MGLHCHSGIRCSPEEAVIRSTDTDTEYVPQRQNAVRLLKSTGQTLPAARHGSQSRSDLAGSYGE